MLIYAQAELLRLDLIMNSNIMVCNFTSLAQTGISLGPLLPPEQVYLCQDKAFDMAYMEYVLADFNAFSTLVNLINSLQQYDHVLILIGEYNPQLVDLNESLQMLIGERYGLPIYRVTTFEDYQDLILNVNATGMHINGIYNFDQDMYKLQVIETEKFVREQLAKGMVFNEHTGSFEPMV